MRAAFAGSNDAFGRAGGGPSSTLGPTTEPDAGRAGAGLLISFSDKRARARRRPVTSRSQERGSAGSPTLAEGPLVRAELSMQRPTAKHYRTTSS